MDIPAGTHTVDVLVENGGRINYGAHLPDGRAGLVDPVLLDGKPLTGWQTFPLPMDDTNKLTGWTTAKIDGSAFHRGTAKIGTPTDTFLDMQAFGKGFAWTDGHNLGRHWKIGPQRALYFPAPTQHKGENRVIVFDLDSAADARVRGVKGQVWSSPSN